MTYQNIPLMVLEIYFPESEIESDAGRSATLKAIDATLTAGRIDMMRARLKLEHDLNVTSTQEDIRLAGVQAKAGHNINLDAARNMILDEIVARRPDGENSYTDHITRTILEAGHDITTTAGLDDYRRAVVMKAGHNITLTAARRIVDMAVAVVHQTFSRHGGDWTLERFVNQHVSEYTAGEKLTQTAGVGQTLQAPKITSQKAPTIVGGEEGVQFQEVHNEYFFQSHYARESGGWFGGGKSSEDVMMAEARSVGAQITSPEEAEFISLGDIGLTNVSLQVPKTTLISINGVVRILLGTNYCQYMRSSSKSDRLYQSRNIRQEQRETFAVPSTPGELEIHAREVIVEQVRGDTLDWMERIQLHGAGDINTVWRDEIHKVESHSVRGPTAAFGAVIALAAGIATYGTGTWLGGVAASSAGLTTSLTATGAVLAAATSAAFTSLCSRAAVDLVTHQGNIGRAADGLAGSDTFRSVVLAGITAGAANGICAGLGIAPLNPSSTWGQSLAHHSVGSAVRASFQMARGEPAERVLSQAALSAAMGAASQQGAAGIGRLMAAGDINALTQKVLHGFNGAVSAALMNPKDMSNAAFAGALGAIVAETFADLAAPDKAEFNERVLARAEREGVDLTNDGQRHALVRDELSGLIKAGQMISATLAMLMGKDPDIAASAARTALENNCLHVIAAGVIIAYRVSKVPGVKPAVKGALRRAGVGVLKAMAGEGMDAAPEDGEWTDEGLTAEDGKPTVLATPAADTVPSVPGYQAAPSDLARGITEGFGIYDGPDAGVLHKDERAIRFPDNPDKAREDFKPVGGTKSKENKIDGSIWERDTSKHGGSQWKRWDNKRSKERNDKPTSVWPDGRVRK